MLINVKRMQEWITEKVHGSRVMEGEMDVKMDGWVGGHFKASSGTDS